MLGYYQTAIQAMLQLPPSDPRNWYRLAFQHYLDCPHGNWWLFPWHRAFTGWAEEIVRRFSGFDHFAFPYWDWTASSQVPAAMAQGYSRPPIRPSSMTSAASRLRFSRRWRTAAIGRAHSCSSCSSATSGRTPCCGTSSPIPPTRTGRLSFLPRAAARIIRTSAIPTRIWTASPPRLFPRQRWPARWHRRTI